MKTRLPLPLKAMLLWLFMVCVWPLTPLKSLEETWGTAGLYALRGERIPPAKIKIISLDLSAAQALGLPSKIDRWPRSVYVELLDLLHQQGALVVGFDVLFDPNRQDASDPQLAQALKQFGKTVLVEYIQRQTHGLRENSIQVDRIRPPVPLLAQAAWSTAPFVVLKQPQGVFEYLAFAPEGDVIPSLPLMMQAAQDWGVLQQLAQLGGMTETKDLSPKRLLMQMRQLAVSQAPRWQPLKKSSLLQNSAAARNWHSVLGQPSAHLRFNFYGSPGQFQTIPLHLALDELRQQQASEWRDTLVLIGLSEFNQPEQRDAYATSWSRKDGVDISGVELAATALANLQQASWLRPTPGVLQGIWTAIWSLLFIACWQFQRLRDAALLSLAGICAMVMTSLYVFTQLHFALPWLVMVGGFLPGIVLYQLMMRYRSEQQLRLQLNRTLERYAPAEILRQLARQVAKGDKTLHVVCLQSDMQDYTTRIEAQEPAQAHEWVQRYFQQAFQCIRQHEGHVVDQAGDSMLCLWFCCPAFKAELPGQVPHIAQMCQKAAAAARDMHHRFNRADSPYPTRIGLHMGWVALGEVGDESQAQPRVVGDIVNTASRIQTLNKQLETKVLASKDVAQHLDASDAIQFKGSFTLKGKLQPVEIYDLTPRTNLSYLEMLG
jgi:adenylate cyclase